MDVESNSFTRSAVFLAVAEFPAGTKLTLYKPGGYAAS